MFGKDDEQCFKPETIGKRVTEIFNSAEVRFERVTTTGICEMYSFSAFDLSAAEKGLVH